MSTYSIAASIQGSTGNDTLLGLSGADVLDGGTGNDRLDGRAGSDTYLFGRDSGYDTIRESADTLPNTDAVLFADDVTPDDVTFKRDGTRNDLLITITGSSSTLRISQYFYQDGVSPYAIEEIRFKDGTVWHYEDIRLKTLEGTSGNDTLVGNAGSDTLDGGAGNDRLDGRDGSDLYRFGRSSGNDLIAESADNQPNTDTVQLDTGIAPGDVSVQRVGTTNDLLLKIAGSTSTLRIAQYFYQDGVSPYAVEQIKFVYTDGTGATATATWDVNTVKALLLAGTSGNDTLIGFASDDTLDGGAGNDRLDGKGGSDTYRFGSSSGNDTIAESADRNANTDTVVVDAASTTVGVRRDGSTNDLLLTIDGASNTLRIAQYFYQDGVSPYAIEQIRFTDTVWTVADLKAEVLKGGAGNDTLVGFSGDDTLDGGAGNDRLDGKAGSDTYWFGKTSGSDTIAESADTNPNTDVVVFTSDIQPGDVTVKRDATTNDLLLSVTGANGTLRIAQYFYQDGLSPYAVEQIYFPSGNVTWSFADVSDLATQGTSANETLIGTSGNDELDGGGGNDRLDGRAGSDIYRFGRSSGNDTIVESADPNPNTDVVLLGDKLAPANAVTPADVTVRRDGSSDDLLVTITGSANTLRIARYFYQEGVGPYAVEQIRFSDFSNTVWSVARLKEEVLKGTSGNDTLIGFSGSDTLDGGAGNDRLDGKAGSDRYVYDRTSGSDTIAESADASVNTDVVMLASDIDPDADVSVRRDAGSNDLLLIVAGGSGTLRIAQYFYQDGTSPYAIEQIGFDKTGGFWTVADVKAKVLIGSGANETLIGFAGIDVLDGGAGNDRLDGKAGSDTYKYGTGSGNDTIAESADAGPNTDTVLLDAGIATTDVTVRRPVGTNDLLLTIAGGSGTLRIAQYFYQDGVSPYAVETIQFVDAGGNNSDAWDVEHVKALTLQGTSGNDTLVGFSGADTLQGGGGNDRLEGKAGADTYLFGKTSGNDTIVESADTGANTDMVLFDATVAVADVKAQRIAGTSDLLLTIANSPSTLRIAQYFYQDGASPYAMELIAFDDGTIWGVEAVKEMVIQGTPGNDLLVGYAGEDYLNGAEGNDELRGGAGNDTLEGGFDNDVLRGDAGADVFRFFNVSEKSDVLMDFTSGVDSIHLGTGYALTPGDQVLLTSGSTTPAGTGEVPQFMYNTSTGELHFDRDGTSTVRAPFLIATLIGHPLLLASDFVIEG